MLVFLINQLRSGCFDNLDRVENVVDCLFVYVGFKTGLCQFLLRIYILIVVNFHLLRDKLLCFVLFQLLFFSLLVQLVYFY